MKGDRPDVVLDASALLAFLQGEPGADAVETALASASVSAANWSEVLQKVSARGADLDVVTVLLLSYGVTIEEVTREDGERAAQMWEPGDGLSLGDRLCLALGQRHRVAVLTADRAWGESDRVIQIR